MSVTKNITFFLQEETGISSDNSVSWSLHRTALDAGYLTAGNQYFCYGWANCVSPGTNEGATKWAFIGGDDLQGSTQERHDTNNSGMSIVHLGTFTAPDPVLPIGIYRKVLFDGGGTESTEAGQFFIIDITDASNDTLPISHAADTSNRTVGIGATIQAHAIDMTGGTCLLTATCRAYGGDGTPTLLGLYIGSDLVSSGSRFTQDSQDNNQILLGGAFSLNSGDVISLKNIDDGTTVTTTYSYISAINVAKGAAASQTGHLTNWVDYGGSGSWGSVNTAGGEESFVFVMGRQKSPGIGSGRPAGVSVKNNTQDSWMAFSSRPLGDFNSHYFPATEAGADMGQYSTAAVVGTSVFASGDEIQVYTV